MTSNYWEYLALTGPRLDSYVISADRTSYACNQGLIQDFLLGGGVYHISSKIYDHLYAILLERGKLYLGEKLYCST